MGNLQYHELVSGKRLAFSEKRNAVEQRRASIRQQYRQLVLAAEAGAPAGASVSLGPSPSPALSPSPSSAPAPAPTAVSPVPIIPIVPSVRTASPPAPVPAPVPPTAAAQPATATATGPRKSTFGVKLQQELALGDRVATVLGEGTLSWLGQADFSRKGKQQQWCGITMDRSNAAFHDGSFDGTQYFDCPAGRGMFCKPTKVTVLRHVTA